MITFTLTEDQVIGLALCLPPERKRELAALLQAADEEPPLIEEAGVWVVASRASGDVEGALQRVREDRLLRLQGAGHSENAL